MYGRRNHVHFDFPAVYKPHRVFWPAHAVISIWGEECGRGGEQTLATSRMLGMVEIDFFRLASHRHRGFCRRRKGRKFTLVIEVHEHINAVGRVSSHDDNGEKMICFILPSGLLGCMTDISNSISSFWIHQVTGSPSQHPITSSTECSGHVTYRRPAGSNVLCI